TAAALCRFPRAGSNEPQCFRADYAWPGGAAKSARGLAQSKTWWPFVESFRWFLRMHWDHEPRLNGRCRASVLDCGSPLPLLRPRAGSESARELAQSKISRCDGRFMERSALFIGIGLCLAFSAPAQDTFTLQVGAPPAPPTPLVNHADTWRYHKGTNAPQAGWQSIADSALDATWASGNGGIGYADNANETSLCQTLLHDMRTNYTTVYLRRSFQISDTIDPDLRLVLTMDWDDGFVAYLDGVEIERALAPGSIGVE